MAMPRRVKLDFEDAFPHGLLMAGDVEAARDFNKSTKDNPVQKIDEQTGLPEWTAECVDADPAATKSTRSLVVRVLAKVQPVPAESTPVGPFKPVAFEGLVGTPWVEEISENFSRISWSFRATGFAPVSPGASASPSSGSESGSSKSSSASKSAA